MLPLSPPLPSAAPPGDGFGEPDLIIPSCPDLTLLAMARSTKVYRDHSSHDPVDNPRGSGCMLGSTREKRR